ncbi:NAD(P)/FAD-dependent oxidoreductase [Rhodobaculum claviforme]|uniref:Deoxyribodipyrimidine photolyase n=1 Tax=Rhodobaculum claviforme TaxID=1549854 RepID=A0A934WFM4_9RHOB|nr:FAD-dependent oxidoreductase [Rhodobaculum claviforme]MBK5926775.1 deoxyribodipyrimidine photolyase [Rhodobaculum claviforme]
MAAPVVVIGAGMAGLACAGRLAQAGVPTLVLDKGRGIGGRLATRRATVAGAAVQFDHGAQYMTAREPAFAALLEGMAMRGAVARWQDGSDRAHWVGAPGMSALPRAMADGLDIRQATEVRALRPGPDGWTVTTETEAIAARAVVLTVPAPQVAPLLEDGHPLARAVAGVALAPCLTLMAAFAADAPIPFASAAHTDEALAWIACDVTKPGRPRGPVTWVAQAAPDWSARHLEASPAALAPRMLALLAGRLGLSADAALHASAHRWRYARVTAPLGQPFVRHAGLWLGGDWCLGPRVEAAWASGTAIAADMLERADVA